MNPPEPGWYRDPYFKNRQRYWDGENWSIECRLTQPSLGSGELESEAGAGSGTKSATLDGHEHVVPPHPVAAQQSAAGQDPVTTEQPAASHDPVTAQQPATPTPTDTQPIRIFSGGVAGGGGVHLLGGSDGDGVPATDEPAAAGAAAAAAAAGAANGAMPATGATDTASASPTKAETTDATSASPTKAETTDTTSAPPTKAEAADNAELVRTAGAAALLGGLADEGTPTAGAPPRTRSVKTPKEPPPEATRRVTGEANSLLGISMPAADSATTVTATNIAIKEKAAKRHRRGLIIAVAAVVVVLAGLGVYVGLNHHSSKGGGKGHKAKTVTAAAAAKTMHEKTASVAISTTLSSPLGQSEGPSATGDFNMTKNEGSMAVTVPPSPTPQQVVFQKKTIYVNVGSQLSAVLPGKTWVSASVVQIGSSSAGVGTSLSEFVQTVGSPLGLLHQLKAGGATVVPLGPSTVDGTPVQGYKVTLSSKALKKSAGLVPAVHTTETVYVAKSGGQIKSIVIPTTTTSGGQLVSQTTTAVFSDYGKPVTVTVPPASETVTLAQYHAAVGQPSTAPTLTPTPTPSGSPTGASSPGSG